MGYLFRKSATRRVPEDAEFFTRKGRQFARWTSTGGKSKSAPVTTGKDGKPRLVIEARTFTARYRDGQGIVREVATGCRTEQGAKTVLADLEKRAELVRSKVITPEQDAIARHHTATLTTQFADYEAHLRAKGATAKWIGEVRRRLETVASECGFSRLADLQTHKVERWLNAQAEADDGPGARTRNAYRSALIAFGSWCVKADRLASNPFARLPRANEAADRRRQRRAMTTDELTLLLRVARWRPLADYGRATITKPKDEQKGRSTWEYEKLTIENLETSIAAAREKLEKDSELIAELERRGRERALIYKTLVLTGLRRNELASLTVGQFRLDGIVPCIELDAADEKNREGSTLPLRKDLADELRTWIDERREAMRTPGVLSIDPKADDELARQRLFDVPEALIKILDRDLRVAGIEKRDGRGRTLDVHALRHTFGTMMSAAGVAPRTAQAAMRHSSIDLTMNTYTDPKILDVQGAVESLPSLPLDGRRPDAARATGTEGDGDLLALNVALAGGKSGHFRSFSDHLTSTGDGAGRGQSPSKNPRKTKRKGPSCDGPDQWAVRDSNTRPSALQAEGRVFESRTAH